MDRDRPTVVRHDDPASQTGPATAGMRRRELLADGDRLVGWVRTEPGIAGGWHHHGDYDSYIYVVRGVITIEYGAGGAAVKAGPGDFVFNPAHLVHREITGPDEPAEAFFVRVGQGPQVVNVDGPEPD